MKFGFSLLLILLSIGNSIALYGYVFKYAKRNHRVFAVIPAALLIAAAIVSRLLDDETAEIITDLTLLLSASVFPYFLFKPQKRKTFVLSGMMLCSVFDFIEYAVASIFGKTSLSETVTVYIIIYAFAFLVTLLIGTLLNTQTVPEFLDQIPSIIFIAVFIINYSAYYGLSVVETAESYAHAAVILNYIAACLSTFGISFIVYRYAVLSKKQKDEEKIFALEMNRYEEIIRNNRDISAFRHDLKNNLFALKTLIEAQRTDEAKIYIDSLTESVNSSKSKFQTGNILADAILTDKSSEAEKSETSIEFEGAVPADGISNRDLCVILSNSLDNAIEACKNIPLAHISVKSELKENGARIIVSNTVSEKVEIHNGKIQTSKADKRLHGFGISNIRKAVKKYNGYVDIFCTECKFTIEMGLIY